MNKRSVIALAVCVSCAVPHSHAWAGVTDQPCDIDSMMDANRVTMDQMAVGIYKKNLQDPMAAQIESAPTVKDASCLPILDTMDTLIRLRIPSTGALLGGLMAKIRDMACKYANDFIAGVVTKLNYNVSDPYGVVSLGAGASTDGKGGVQTTQYDFSKVVSDAVQDVARQKTLEYTSEASSAARTALPSPTSDRTTRTLQNNVSTGLKDAINGL